MIPRLFLFALICCLFASPVAMQDEPLYPGTLQPITAENATELTLMETFGRGAANTLDWHPDGTQLAVGTATGIWLLDESLNVVAHPFADQPVNFLVWSPDGSQIALSSTIPYSCYVEVWDADFTQLIFDLPDFCGDELRWSSEGSYLSALSWSGYESTVALIDVANGNYIDTLPGSYMAWSPSGRILFTSTISGRFDEISGIFTWDARTGRQIKFTTHFDNYQQYLWATAENQILVTCSETNADNSSITGQLCDLNTNTGKITPKLSFIQRHLDQSTYVEGITFDENHNRLLYIMPSFTRGFLDDLISYDISADQHTFIGYAEIYDWKPNSEIITLVVGNGLIQNVDATSAEVLIEMDLFTAPLNSIAWRPLTSQLASSPFGYEQFVRVWDVNGSNTEPALTFWTEPAENIAYTPDSSQIITSGTILTDIVVDYGMFAFDPDTGNRLDSIDGFYDQGMDMPVRAWNSDFTMVAQADENGIVTLSNGMVIDTQSVFSEESNANMILQRIYWSPDDKLIATVSRYSKDLAFIVAIWNAKTGEQINFIMGGQYLFSGLLWSPDSSKLVIRSNYNTMASGYVGSQLAIYPMDMSLNYIYRVFIPNLGDNNSFQSPVMPVTWNRIGTLLAVGRPHGIEIYNADTGESEHMTTLEAFEIDSIAWSEDDRMIAGASLDGTIRVWGVPEEDN